MEANKPLSDAVYLKGNRRCALNVGDCAGGKLVLQSNSQQYLSPRTNQHHSTS
jgi:hypothetical protein